MEAEASELIEAAALELFGAALLEVGRAEIAIGGLVGNQMGGDLPGSAATTKAACLRPWCSIMRRKMVASALWRVRPAA